MVRIPIRTAALVVGAVFAISGCGGSGAGAGTAFSPYVDVTLNAGRSPASAVREAGVGAVTTGFLDAASGCRAAWGGQTSDRATAMAAVRALRGSARLTISFGGRDGTDLALACTTTGALRAQYRAAVAQTGVRALDFDIEGAALADGASISRRWAALAGIAGISVTATLPSEPSGLTAAGLRVLRAATASHLRLAAVNILAMDFGDANAPRPAGRMAAYVERAGAAAAAQLQALYPSPASRPRLVVTVMIGRNDVSGEVLGLADARAVLTYARRTRIGGLSMWSLGRDRQCPAGTPPAAQPTCSGVAQSPYAFARILRVFR